MLPYDQLLELLPKLRFKDDTALRTIGLAPLAKTYDAYPVSTASGGRCYCLLAKGSDIPNARKLTPGTASKQIIVLSEGTKGFAKVWPNANSTKAEGAAPKAVAPSSPAQAQTKAEDKPGDTGPVGSLEFVDD